METMRRTGVMPMGAGGTGAPICFRQAALRTVILDHGRTVAWHKPFAGTYTARSQGFDGGGTG